MRTLMIITNGSTKRRVTHCAQALREQATGHYLQRILAKTFETSGIATAWSHFRVLCTFQLLSVGRIGERGFSTVFGDKKADVRKRHHLILSAENRGRLYAVEEEHFSSLLVDSQDDAADPLLWHRRLGHLHLDAVNYMCGGRSSAQQERCRVCTLGKMRRKSFPTAHRPSFGCCGEDDANIEGRVELFCDLY